MKKTNRFLCLILSGVMAISLFPGKAFASSSSETSYSQIILDNKNFEASSIVKPIFKTIQNYCGSPYVSEFENGNIKLYSSKNIEEISYITISKPKIKQIAIKYQTNNSNSVFREGNKLCPSAETNNINAVDNNFITYIDFSGKNIYSKEKNSSTSYKLSSNEFVKQDGAISSNALYLGFNVCSLANPEYKAKQVSQNLCSINVIKTGDRNKTFYNYEKTYVFNESVDAINIFPCSDKSYFYTISQIILTVENPAPTPVPKPNEPSEDKDLDKDNNPSENDSPNKDEEKAPAPTPVPTPTPNPSEDNGTDKDNNPSESDSPNKDEEKAPAPTPVPTPTPNPSEDNGADKDKNPSENDSPNKDEDKAPAPPVNNQTDNKNEATSQRDNSPSYYDNDRKSIFDFLKNLFGNNKETITIENVDKNPGVAKNDNSKTEKLLIKNATVLDQRTFEVAKESNKTILADTTENKKVVSRVYIPADKEISSSLSVKPDNYGARKAEGLFERFFDNNIKSIKFGEDINPKVNLRVAVKLDLSDIDTDNLYFYAYRSSTNSYYKIKAPSYKIDDHSYLYFNMPMERTVVISDKPLKSK